MKLTPDETEVVALIRAAGGSVCPGVDFHPTAWVQKIIRRLDRLGVITVEPTDDGPRFTVREGG